MKSLLKDCLLLALLYVPVAGLIYSAPLPAPKARPGPSLPGTYDMVFHGTVYPTVLLEGGTYVATTDTNSLRWEGTWELKGDRFTIKERLVDPYQGPQGDFHTYTFTMKPCLRESVGDGLKLKRVR